MVSFPAPGEYPPPSLPPPPPAEKPCVCGGVEWARWKGGHPFPPPLGVGVGCPVAPGSRVPLRPPRGRVWGRAAARAQAGVAFRGRIPAFPRVLSAAAVVSSRAPREMRGPGEAGAGEGEPSGSTRPPPPHRVLGCDRPRSAVSCTSFAAQAPAPAWTALLVARRGGERARVFAGATPPSARKPSLAIREGALGYRSPQPPPPPSVRDVGQSWGPTPSAPPHAPCGSVAGDPPPSDGCSSGLPRPAPPPSESGEGHAGPRARVSRRGCGRARGAGRVCAALVSPGGEGEVRGGDVRPRL